MDILVHHLDERGELTSGWHVVASRLASQYCEGLIRQGIEARALLPVNDPRRREIDTWVDLLRKRGYVPAGNYVLRGKATVIVERATDAARHAARERSELADAVHRARRYNVDAGDARRIADARDRRIAEHDRVTAGYVAHLARIDKAAQTVKAAV